MQRELSRFSSFSDCCPLECHAVLSNKRYRCFGAMYGLRLQHSEYGMLLDMWYTYRWILTAGLRKDPSTIRLASGQSYYGSSIWSYSQICRLRKTVTFLRTFCSPGGFRVRDLQNKKQFFNCMSKTITANSIRKCKLILTPPPQKHHAEGEQGLHKETCLLFQLLVESPLSRGLQ
jgi:hypothetical protein